MLLVSDSGAIEIHPHGALRRTRAAGAQTAREAGQAGGIRPPNGRSPGFRGHGLKSEQMAERAGFEPAMEFNPHTRLAGECLQPLGHLSWRSSHQCKAWDRRAAGLESAGAGPTSHARRRSICSRPHRGCPGRVAERLNAAVLKTVDGGNVVRGFESPPFRFVFIGNTACPRRSARARRPGSAPRGRRRRRRRASSPARPGLRRRRPGARSSARGRRGCG